MISTITNPQGFVAGYIEWEIVDHNGQFEENGHYIYIANAWVHPYRRNKKLLNQLIQKINTHPFAYNARWVYWEIDRRKPNKDLNRKIRIFSRDRLGKIGVKHEFKEIVPRSSPCTSCTVSQ